MNTRAYLVGFIDKLTLKVEVIDVYSEDAQHLTIANNRWFAFNICEAYGKDFQAASDALQMELKKPYYAWVHAIYKPRKPPQGPFTATMAASAKDKRRR